MHPAGGESWSQADSALQQRQSNVTTATKPDAAAVLLDVLQ
jgi:hypothetical protein